MTIFQLYLLTLMPNVGIAAWVVFGISLIAMVLVVTAWGVTQEDRPSERLLAFWAWCKLTIGRLITAAVVAGIVGTLIPTKSDIMFILGGSALTQAAQNDRVKGVADQSLKVVEKWLADQAKETTK